MKTRQVLLLPSKFSKQGSQSHPKTTLDLQITLAAACPSSPLPPCLGMKRACH